MRTAAPTGLGWAGRCRHVEELRPDLTWCCPGPDPAELSIPQPWEGLEAEAGWRKTSDLIHILSVI